MAHELNCNKIQTNTRNKQDRRRIHDEANNINASTLEFEEVPRSSNHGKKELRDFSPQIEKTIIKKEPDLFCADNSLEDEYYWDSNLSDMVQVESNRYIKNNVIGINKEMKNNKKIYPIENKCSMCNKKFSFQRELVKHAQQAHPNAKAFKCQYCTTVFSKLKSVTTHLKRCHANLAKTISCDYCTKTFFTASQLKRHRRTHTEHLEIMQRENNKDITKNNDETHKNDIDRDIFQRRRGKIYPIENKCAICIKPFSFQKDLIKHTVAHPNGKVFKCRYCATTFSHLKSVTTHYNRSHSKLPKTIFCDYCDMSFFTKFLLERHRRSHMEQRPFSCHQCDKTYKYKRNLCVHMKTHSNDNTTNNEEDYIDEYCENDEEMEDEYGENDQYLLAGDEYCKDDDQNLLTEDDYCDNDNQNLFAEDGYYENSCSEDNEQNVLSEDEEESVNIANMSNVDNFSNLSQYPFRCNECGSVYKHKEHLKTHLKTHKESNEATDITVDDSTTFDQDNTNLYKSTYFIIDEFNTDSEHYEEFDDVQYAVGADYSNHYEGFAPVNTEASFEDKQNDCGICLKSFGCQQSVARHIQRCHPEIELFKCPYCDDNFYSLDSLSLHITLKKHPQKRNVCEHCLKSFDRRSDLKRHLKTHNDDYQFICNLCHKTFKKIHLLRRHEETMHYFYEPQKFDCEFCPKSFPSDEMLQRHRSIHAKRGAYSCSYCSKIFNHRYDWHRHEQTHSSRKDLICEYCMRSFNDTETLNCHLKVHTGEFKFLCTICNKSYRMKSHLINHIRGHRNC